ncbi:hypothetical protein [Streptomyces sp. NPDC059564]
MAAGTFQEFVGSHGSLDGIEITPWWETGGERQRLWTWTKDRGLEIYREM